MKTQTTIRTIGNSLGIIIPKLYAEHLNIKENDTVTLEDGKTKGVKYVNVLK